MFIHFIYITLAYNGCNDDFNKAKYGYKLNKHSHTVHLLFFNDLLSDGQMIPEKRARVDGLPDRKLQEGSDCVTRSCRLACKHKNPHGSNTNAKTQGFTVFLRIRKHIINKHNHTKNLILPNLSFQI